MATLRFTASAGILIRREFRKAIEEYAWNRHYGINIIEDKGLLGSSYRVELTLPDDDYDTAHATIKKWLTKLTKESD